MQDVSLSTKLRLKACEEAKSLKESMPNLVSPKNHLRLSNCRRKVHVAVIIDTATREVLRKDSKDNQCGSALRLMQYSRVV